MEKFYTYIAVVFVGLLSISGAYAQSGLSIGYGETDEDMEIYRVGYQSQWESEWFKSKYGYWSGYHEFSMSYWHWPSNGRIGRSKSDGATVGAYSPVFQYYLGDGTRPSAYIEIGFGVSLVSDTVIGHSNLGSAFQFEDRLGLGIDFGDHDLVARYMHYSNAGISPPNSGIDIFIVAYTVRF